MELQEVHDRLFQFCGRSVLIFGDPPEEHTERSLNHYCECGPIMPPANAYFTEELANAWGCYPVLFVSFDCTFERDILARDALTHFHGEEQKRPEEFEYTLHDLLFPKIISRCHAGPAHASSGRAWSPCMV